MVLAQSKVKPIIGRVGGKSKLAPWIIEHLSRFEWSIYCEPFAGSAAVYFRMVQDGIFEKIKERGHHGRVVLNDADSRIVQLFKVCRDHPELLAYAVAMTPYSRSEHKLAQQGLDEVEDAIEQARQYLVDGWQSFKYENGDVWGIQKEKVASRPPSKDSPRAFNDLPSRILAASPHLQGEPNPIDSLSCLNEVGRSFVQPSVDVRVEMARRYLVDGWQSRQCRHSANGDNNFYWAHRTETKKDKTGVGGNSPEAWQSLPDRILTATQHLKKCYIENDDAIKCIERWASPHTAIYADPPYLNCEDYYSHNAKQGKDYNKDLHYRLAECLNTVEAACVAVSYYPDPLLDELYPEADWERHYKETVASSAGITRQSKTRTRPKRTELLLVRKNRNAERVSVALSGQMALF